MKDDRARIHSIAAELSRGRADFSERAAMVSELQAIYAEKDAEIARLRIQIDELEGMNVVLFLEKVNQPWSDLWAAYADQPQGTILRATDTGNEWIKRGEGFEPNER